MPEVLLHPNKYGQGLDLEVAEDTRVPPATIRGKLAELRATPGARDVQAGALRRRPQCRVSWYAPKPAPGRKLQKAA